MVSPLRCHLHPFSQHFLGFVATTGFRTVEVGKPRVVMAFEMGTPVISNSMLRHVEGVQIRVVQETSAQILALDWEGAQAHLSVLPWVKKVAIELSLLDGTLETSSEDFAALQQKISERMSLLNEVKRLGVGLYRPLRPNAFAAKFLASRETQNLNTQEHAL